jgi:hypothetical protein
LHTQLIEILKLLKAKHIDQFNLLIPYANAKIDNINEIIDADSKAALKIRVDELMKFLD